MSRDSITINQRQEHLREASKLFPVALKANQKALL